MSEAELERAVMELARLLGFLVAHFRPAQVRPGRWATAMSGDTGYPDLTLAGNGRLLFVELKAARGRFAPEQMVWRDAIVQAGQEWYGWRPQDWIDGTVERVLRQPAGGDSVIGRLARAAA